ncbi:MAG: DUF1223 domain-containing protein [Betaproteobacteria bacterium]
MSLSLLIAAAVATQACTATSPPTRVALVELYTSQGCSSCPPADRWLTALPQRFGPAQALPVALHVGYWDYIGWKDPFARREFNERQRRLANLAGERTVYTPGVFVDGRPMPEWSSTRGFDAAIQSINRRPAAVDIGLTVAAQRADAIDFTLTASARTVAAAEGGELYVALLQGGQVTAVRAGENRGESLRNDHVAREWRGPYPLGAQRLSIALPAGATPAQLSLLAFVQDPKTGAVLQAVGLPLAGCRP